MLCVSIKCGIVLSPEWSFNDQFNQVIHNWYYVVFLNYRNEHIWPPTRKWLHIFEAFHLASLQIITFDHFWTKHLFLRSAPEIFDISILRISLWLFGHHTFQYKLSFFPSQILVCVTAFAAHFLFLRFDICWAIRQKHKKCGKIYRHKSMHVSKPSRLLTNHSWQVSRSIYNSHT